MGLTDTTASSGGADGREGSGQPLLVWGAGAMGGSIGGVLAREGRAVLFVDRVRDHVGALNEHGLRVTGPIAEFEVSAKARHPDDIQGTFPLIFLCVKAHHTREALAQLAPHLEDDGAVVSIQNGLCEMDISEVVGPQRTVGAFVNFGADYLEPGVIHWGGRGAVVVGELDGRPTKRVQVIYELLCLFEPAALLTSNILGYLWGKLSYAALLFATALTEASIADVLANTEHRPTLIALAREVVAVADARGISLEGFDGFDPKAFRANAANGLAEASLDDLVAFNRRSAKTHSGIWRDLAVRKRTTEVDAQLGAVVRLGDDAGVVTPLVEQVITQIHQIESGEREMSWDNLDELRTAAL